MGFYLSIFVEAEKKDKKTLKIISYTEAYLFKDLLCRFLAGMR